MTNELAGSFPTWLCRKGGVGAVRRRTRDQELGPWLKKKARRVCPDAPIFWVFAESEVFAVLGCTHIIEKFGNFEFSLGFGFCRELLD